MSIEGFLAVQSLAQSLPEVDLYGFGDLASSIAKSIINGILTLIRAILAAILLMFLKVMEPLAFQTPAIRKPILIGGDWASADKTGKVLSSDGVFYVPGLAGPNGVIENFYNMSLAVGFSIMGLFLVIAFAMFGFGFLPRIKEAAVDYMKKFLFFAIFAVLSSHFFQILIDFNAIATHAIYQGSNYEENYTRVFDSLLEMNDIMDELSLILGLLVADLAILVVILELAVRMGVVVFIPAVGPLVMVLYAFPITRAVGQKMLRFFISATFFQFFVAIGVSLMLQVVVAFHDGASAGSGFSVPSWAIVAGLASMVAYLPKVLSGASEAISGAMAPVRAAAGAAIGVGVGAAVTTAGAAGRGAASYAAGAARGTGTQAGEKIAAGIEKYGGRASSRALVKGKAYAQGASRNYVRSIKEELGLGGLSRHPSDDIGEEGQWHDGGGGAPRSHARAAGGHGPGAPPPGSRDAGGGGQAGSGTLAGRAGQATRAALHRAGFATTAAMFGTGRAAWSKLTHDADPVKAAATDGAIRAEVSTGAPLADLQKRATDLQASPDPDERQLGMALGRNLDGVASLGPAGEEAFNAMQSAKDAHGLLGAHQSALGQAQKRAAERALANGSYARSLHNATQGKPEEATAQQKRDALQEALLQDPQYGKEKAGLDHALRLSAAGAEIPLAVSEDGSPQASVDNRPVARPTPVAAAAETRAFARLHATASHSWDSAATSTARQGEAANAMSAAAAVQIHSAFAQSPDALDDFRRMAESGPGSSPDEATRTATREALADLSSLDRSIRSTSGLPQQLRNGGVGAFRSGDAETRQVIVEALVERSAGDRSYAALAPRHREVMDSLASAAGPTLNAREVEAQLTRIRAQMEAHSAALHSE